MSAIRSNRWAWIVSGVAMSGAGLVLAFMLVFATQNRERFEPHFVWLFWTNVVIASVLGLVIVLALARLAIRVRRRKFGSRLLLKLARIFALVALAPGLLIYGVSYQFVSRSIETWFDIRVESALDAGLNLARSTMDSLSQDLSSKTQLAAERMSGLPGTPSSDGVPPLLTLERLREQMGADSVALISESGVVETQVGGDNGPELNTARIPSTLRQEAKAQGVATLIEGLDDGNAPKVMALAWMPDRGFSLQSRGRYLLVQRALQKDLVRNALDVQNAYREYQQRSLGREGLRRMYIGTLTLSLVLAVFGAMVLAATLGQQLAHPLLLLAEGVGEVARGDLSPKAIFASQDELGGLTRDFANMTQQLADARSEAEQSAGQLESARAHVQTILDNLTSGVIVFDEHGHIDTVNPGATRILRAPVSAYRGQPMESIPSLRELATSVNERFATYARDPEPGERQQWQESFEITANQSHLQDLNESQTLLVRGADLPDRARLIVFDDITELVSAQRSKAWGEVARRVAHEIKNPLTPIQLSAERLQMKLHDKLDEPGQQLLHRSVNTIVTQVQALKNLINEFRDFARLPTARLANLDLNALINEVLVLYGHAIETGEMDVHLSADIPLIEGDAALLRQVVHNLVQNAFDATQEMPVGSGTRVQLCTELRQDEQGQVQAVRLVIRDNGAGFSEKVLKRAFEPYVTTKSHGTGLGLAVVKKIADEHEAIIRLRNLAAPGNPSEYRGMTGAQVSLSFSKLSFNSPQAASFDSTQAS